ncbi:NAD(P)-binding rossmann-like domain-containing protein [Ditylenchus destructor]|nr:NAD(P)-binding rossmann-like domain-containing protein [Ditylenchus destructor]
MNKIECDVLVVGAGISGLVAAREISKLSKDLRVLVLEAKSRVGGRTLSVDLKVHNKNGPAVAKFDIGGQWVGLTQTHILDLIKELGLDIYPQYAEGKKLAQLGKTKIRSYSSSLPSTKELR